MPRSRKSRPLAGARNAPTGHGGRPGPATADARGPADEGRSSPEWPGRRALVWGLLPPLLALLAFLPILGNGFAHDDHSIIQKNPAVLGQAPWTAVFTEAYWPPGWARLQYRPLTTLSLRVDWTLAGRAASPGAGAIPRPGPLPATTEPADRARGEPGAPAGAGSGPSSSVPPPGPAPLPPAAEDGASALFHVENVALLAAIVALLALVLRQRGSSLREAALASALFAVHPLHVEAVAPAVGRSELGVALLSLAVLAMRPGWSRAVREGRRPAALRAAAMALVSLAAMGFKEHGVMLPAVVLVDLLAFDRAVLPLPARFREGPAPGPRTGPADRDRPWPTLALDAAILLGLLAAATLAFVALHTSIAGGAGRDALAEAFYDVAPLNPLLRGTLAERLMTATALLGVGVRKMLLPWPLVVDWSGESMPVVRSPLDPAFLLGAAVFLAIAVLAVRARDRRLRWAIGVAAAFWFPVSQIPFPTGIIFAERLWFLPSLAVAAGFAGLIERGLRSPRQGLRAGTAASAAALLAVGTALTALRLPDWKDSCTLAAADVARNPLSSSLLRVDGMCALDEGDVARARLRANDVVRIAPRYAAGWLLAAQVRHGDGDLRGAIEAARTVVDLRPQNLDGRALLSDLLWKEGRRADAIEENRVLLALRPSDPGLRRGLAEKLAQSGDLDGARSVWREGAAAFPGEAAMYLGGGETELLYGSAEGAVGWAEQAVRAGVPRMSPGWVDATGQAIRAGRLQQVRDALPALRRLYPVEPGLVLHEGATLRRLGDLPGARSAYRELLARFPGHPLAGRARTALAEIGEGP